MHWDTQPLECPYIDAYNSLPILQRQADIVRRLPSRARLKSSIW